MADGWPYWMWVVLVYNFSSYGLMMWSSHVNIMFRSEWIAIDKKFFKRNVMVAILGNLQKVIICKPEGVILLSYMGSGNNIAYSYIIASCKDSRVGKRNSDFLSSQSRWQNIPSIFIKNRRSKRTSENLADNIFHCRVLHYCCVLITVFCIKLSDLQHRNWLILFIFPANIVLCCWLKLDMYD